MTIIINVKMVTICYLDMLLCKRQNDDILPFYRRAVKLQRDAILRAMSTQDIAVNFQRWLYVANTRHRSSSDVFGRRVDVPSVPLRRSLTVNGMTSRWMFHVDCSFLRGWFPLIKRKKFDNVNIPVINCLYVIISHRDWKTSDKWSILWKSLRAYSGYAVDTDGLYNEIFFCGRYHGRDHELSWID